MVKSFLQRMLAVWSLGCLGLLGASTETERELLFKVMLDDRNIGLHSFRVSREDGREVVDISADFDVTFLAISFYSYEHVNRETWVNGCLDTIESATDDNGDEFRVEGRDQGASFELATQDGRVELEARCVMTFAYWNRDFLDQPRLLNAQNGEYLPVEVVDEGAEEISLGGQTVAANRYRVRNAQQGIDVAVWYARDSGEWLSLESRVEGGRVIRYLPVSRADTAAESMRLARNSGPGAESGARR